MNPQHRPDYPVGFERAWLDLAKETFGARTDFQTLDRLAPLASDLSDAFTVERQAGFKDYSASRDHWLAYGAYFFPQTYVRMSYVLQECLRSGWGPAPDSGPVRLLDLGAGTGAATAAATLALAGHSPDRPIHVLAIDASETALTLLRAFQERAWSRAGHITLATRTGSIRGPQSLGVHGAKGWDLITVSFALNEVLESAAPDAAERWVREALSCLAPGGLLVMLEPALHAACERIERLRDAVSAQRLARIVAPCPHHQPCPMLALPDTWCHDVRRWRVPESVEYTNRKLQRNVHFLKYCFLALAADSTPPPDPRGISRSRIVAPLSDPRGRITTFGCAADGLIHPYEVQTRELKGEAKRAVLDLDRGECPAWRGAALLGDGRTVRGVPEIR